MHIPVRSCIFLVLSSITAVFLLSACSDGSDTRPTERFTITSYNTGLALNVVPFANERLVANETLLRDYDNDVICFQEIWLEEHLAALKEILEPEYPYQYSVEPEQIFTEDAACTAQEISGFEECTRANCPGLTDSELVACAPAQCGIHMAGLSPQCLDGVIGASGSPGITVDSLVETVTQPAGKFAYDGSLGLLLVSKYELRNREFQDFIEDSSGNHRGALYAEIAPNQKSHLVGCTHPTANLSDTIDYPPSGKHGSWEGENRFMQEKMIAYANNKAGGKPIYFAGDFNCSLTNASNSVDADFPDNCQLWLDDGFIDPAGEQLPCTFCYDYNSILQARGGTGNTLLDHVFVKNLDSSDQIVAKRVFDDQVSIEALVPPAELKPESSPMMTHPSDHFGVELEVELP